MNWFESPARGRFECWLRSHKVPFVDVAEAQRELRPGRRRGADGKCKPELGAFDFVVYAPGGSLLVYITDRPNSRKVRMMAQWQRLFGLEFRAVFVRMMGMVPVFAALDGRPVDHGIRSIDATPVIESAKPAKSSAPVKPQRQAKPLEHCKLFSESLFGGVA